MPNKLLKSSLAGLGIIALSCTAFASTTQTIVTSNSAGAAATATNAHDLNLPVVALLYGTPGTNMFKTPVEINGVKVSSPSQITYNYTGSTANPQFSKYKGKTYKLCAVFDGSKESYGFMGVGSSTGGYKAGAIGWGPGKPLTNPTIKSNNYSSFGNVQAYCGTITAIQYLYLKPDSSISSADYPLAISDYTYSPKQGDTTPGYTTPGYPADGGNTLVPATTKSGLPTFVLPVNTTASGDTLQVQNAADGNPQGVFIPLSMPSSTAGVTPNAISAISLQNGAPLTDGGKPVVHATLVQAATTKPTTNVALGHSNEATAVISNQAMKK